MGGRKKCRSSGKHVVPVWSRLHPRTCRPLACCPQYQALPHPHPAPFQVPQAINPLAESLDPDEAKEAWQRFYFKGEIPEALGSAPETHANKRRLKTPRVG